MTAAWIVLACMLPAVGGLAWVCWDQHRELTALRRAPAARAAQIASLQDQLAAARDQLAEAERQRGHYRRRCIAYRVELAAMAGELVHRSWEHRNQQRRVAAAALTPDDLTGLHDPTDLEAAVLADIAALPTTDTTEERP